MGKIKIIAGKLKGRVINFSDQLPVRPTASRTKETLFNWLTTDIHGASCLDLYSGTGSLAVEAVSRGANKVLAIDNTKECLHHLQEIIRKFAIKNLSILDLCIPKDKLTIKDKFTIVFIDPPFRQNLTNATIEWITSNNLLAKDALIYIEIEKHGPAIAKPDNWLELKCRESQEVRYYLFKAK